MAVNGYVDYDSTTCVSQLPVGYRFDPTDDVLLTFYLRKKIFNQPLPRHGILQCDVFQTEPWLLPVDNRNSFSDRRYYFFDLRNRRFEKMDIRGAGGGEWRIVERINEVPLRSHCYIGVKNTFEYWKMEGTQAVKSEWMMEEFHIAPILHPNWKSFVAAYRVSKRKVARVEKKVSTPTVIDLSMEDESESENPSASS